MCECNVLVTQTLSYPTQLATDRHPPPFSQNPSSDTCVNCRASIFGALQLPSSNDCQIGFFSVKIDVGSTRISKTFSSKQTFSAVGSSAD